MPVEQIMLYSFGHPGSKIAEVTSKDIEHEFSVPVQVREGHLDLGDYYDASRRQYDGNLLLKKIETDYTFDNSKTLGIFGVDLFIPILTYIFGQAYLNGKAGIASIHRLSNERYGMVRNEGLMLKRFRKEAIHELGHTFGLLHCMNIDCVMRSSTYVEDIDQKSHHLCNNCRATLQL